jgi:hypothetical protein
VISIITSLPGSPANGDRYLVAHSGTSGALVGKEDQVVERIAGAWVYSGAPATGQTIVSQAIDLTLTWNGSAWLATTAAQVAQTADGTDAAIRSVGGILKERKSVTDYLLSGDTDLTDAFTRAIASFNSDGRGGRLLLPSNPSDYPAITAGDIAFPTADDCPLWIDGEGSLLLHAGSGDLFAPNNGETGTRSPRHIISGVIFDKASEGDRGLGRAINSIDTTWLTIKHCVFLYFGTAIRQINSMQFSENLGIHDCDFWHNNIGIDFDAEGAPIGSQATVDLHRVDISMQNAISATPVGIRVAAGTSVYGGDGTNVAIFPDKTGAIGCDIYGDMSGFFGHFRFENPAGGPSTAWKVHDGANVDVHIFNKYNGVNLTRVAISGTPLNVAGLFFTDSSSLIRQDIYTGGALISGVPFGTYPAIDWTPVLKGQSVAGAQTYTKQVGRISREGNKRTAEFHIILSALDVATSGPLIIDGLPSAAANLSSRFGASPIFFGDIGLSSGYTQMSGHVPPNSSFIQLVQSGSGLSGANVGAGLATDTTELSGTVTYFE